MLGFIVITAVLILIIITILFLPLSYALTIYIGEPFRCCGHVCWLGQAFYYHWDITWGKPIKTACCICWKKKKEDISAEPTESMAPETPLNGNSIAAALEKDGPSLTYTALQKEDIPPTAPEPDTTKQTETKKKSAFPWRRYILNSAFAETALTFISRILHHSRIRQLSLTGTIGLEQPHETGMLAGTLYAITAICTTDLTFNFIQEEYDCTVKASGRIYPLVLLAYSTAFAASKPIRPILAYWHHTKRGVHHG